MINIIGCGVTGSRVAMLLSAYKNEDIHLWDFDTIEEHNILNQLYDIEDIGKPKVLALAEKIKRRFDKNVTIHNEKVTGGQIMEGTIFLLTDTMESRKEIWEFGIQMNPLINLMIETRIGIDSARVYTINPNNKEEGIFWKSTLSTKEQVQRSMCGAKIPIVGAIADIVGGIAVLQYINQIKNKETIIGFNPIQLYNI